MTSFGIAPEPALDHRGERALQRHDRPLELHQLPLELVDPCDPAVHAAGRRRCASTASMSSSTPVGHLEVGVDDPVEDRVDHRPRARARAARAWLSSSARTGASGADVAVPDGDHEVRPDEHHEVAGLDDLAGLGQLGVLDVAGGADDQEGHLAVLLDLGALAALDGVLDRELVELEDGRDVLEVGRARLVQAEPDERVVARAGRGQRLGVVELARLALAVDIEAAVDDRAAGAGGRRRPGVGSAPVAKIRVTARTGAGDRGAGRWRPGAIASGPVSVGVARCRPRGSRPPFPVARAAVTARE